MCLQVRKNYMSPPVNVIACDCCQRLRSFARNLNHNEMTGERKLHEIIYSTAYLPLPRGHKRNMSLEQAMRTVTNIKDDNDLT